MLCTQLSCLPVAMMTNPKIRFPLKSNGLRLSFVLVAFALWIGLTPQRTPAASPGWAATASLLLPGVGQALNGDYPEAAAHFATYMALTNNYFIREEKPEFLLPEDRIDDENKVIYTNRTTFEADLFLTWAFNQQLYSSYGAYRDARQAINNKGYTTPAPDESLAELAVAPFNPQHLLRPTTFIPLVLPLIVLNSALSDEQYIYQPDDTLDKQDLRKGFFLMHEAVALGEESFFRGVLNNSFSNSLGEGWGLAASSAAFGLAHSGSAGQASAPAAALFGGYLGYLQQKNDYRIGQGVAIHFWWNFLVSLSMLKERPTQPVQLISFYTEF